MAHQAGLLSTEAKRRDRQPRSTYLRGYSVVHPPSVYVGYKSVYVDRRDGIVPVYSLGTVRARRHSFRKIWNGFYPRLSGLGCFVVRGVSHLDHYESWSGVGAVEFSKTAV